jgi:glyoxylase-like metal-dependent hydrolase (beta-lactamase superfamily II)
MQRRWLIRFAGTRALVLTCTVATGAAVALAGRALAQQTPNFDAVQQDVVPVRGGMYMLVGAGGNTTIMAGDEGVMVVDTQFAPLSAKILDVVRTLSDQPIRYVVNTHMHPDHIGGNEAIAKAGRTRAGGNVVGDLGAAATATAKIIAHENVLLRLARPAPGQDPVPFGVLPTDTYVGRKWDMRFNGEAVQIMHQPKAHTDGDSLVFFRSTDVIATGDLFTTVMYPFIDEANGGTIDGYIDALNAILDLAVFSNVNEGGTMIVPGHGRLCDKQDVIEYRDMATIVRDRIREYVRRGMTLDQVKAARPTLDFDPRYNTPNGFWTADRFVEVIYRQMKQAQDAAGQPRAGSQKRPATAPAKGSRP